MARALGGGGGAGSGADREAIVRLVRDLGDRARTATVEEVAHLRAFFAARVLPSNSDPTRGSSVRYLLEKFELHVRDRPEWTAGVSPDEYLSSLRAAVRHRAGGLRIFRDPDLGQWALLFVAPSGRWRGPRGGSHIVVLFNAERTFWVTGFQPRDGLAYARRQGGWWIRTPG